MSKFKFGDWVQHVKFGHGVVVAVRIYSDGNMYDIRFANGIESSCDEEDLTPYTPPAPEGTIQVRIAVAVGQTGHKHAEIIVEPDDEKEAIAHAKAQVYSPVDGDNEVCATIITGYAFLPQPPAEVRGTVEGGGE